MFPISLFFNVFKPEQSMSQMSAGFRLAFIHLVCSTTKCWFDTVSPTNVNIWFGFRVLDCIFARLGWDQRLKNIVDSEPICILFFLSLSCIHIFQVAFTEKTSYYILQEPWSLQFGTFVSIKSPNFKLINVECLFLLSL